MMGHGASVSRSGSSVWQQEEDPEWNDFSQITVAPEALHFWSRRHGSTLNYMAKPTS